MEGTAKTAVAIAAAYGLSRVSERAASIIVFVTMMLYIVSPTIPTIEPPTIAFSTIDSPSIVPPTVRLQCLGIQ